MSDDEGIEAALAFAGLAAAAGMLWKVIETFQGNSNKSEVERLYREGLNYQGKGMYQEAFQAYQKCLERDPQNAGVCNQIAWILAIHNQGLEIAERYAEKAIRLTSDTESKANYYDTLAEVYARQGKLDEAIVEFRRTLSIYGGIERDHPNYSPSFRLALCYFMKGDINSAVFYLNNALKVNPENPHVYGLMGEICLTQERYSSAISFYNKAISVSPTWNFMYPITVNFDTAEQRVFFVSNWWVNIGAAYYHLEEYDNSWNAHVEAYKTNNTNPFPLINLASLCALRGQKAEMRRFLEAGITYIDPQLHSGLISFMVTHPNFNPYRDLVLDMLRSNNKITQSDYVQYKKALAEGFGRGHSTDGGITVSIDGSTVGNLQIGSGNSASGISTNRQKQTKNRKGKSS